MADTESYKYQRVIQDLRLKSFCLEYLNFCRDEIEFCFVIFHIHTLVASYCSWALLDNGIHLLFRLFFFQKIIKSMFLISLERTREASWSS
jgi:hypothetical protein